MAITGSQPAYSLAQSGVMRSGTSRSNVHTPLVFIAIDGVQYATARATDAEQVDNETLTITENEGETPNTAAFQVRGFQPTNGQDVVITQGSINNLERLFAGTVMTDAHSYVGTPANGRDRVNVIDYTWQLTRGTISRRWTNVSATVIARDIIADAGRGISGEYVEEDLPIVDEFTVTNQTHAAALGNLCNRIGASYWKVNYHKEVWLGLASDPNQTNPTELTDASAKLVEMIDLNVTRDLSQVITRQPVEGGGSTALTEVPAGETILPVEDAGWYNAGGGLVVSGPQRIGYAGLQEGGAGSVVGPSVAPSVAPTATTAPGGSVDTGEHDYAYLFGTAVGKSLTSPTRRIATSTTPIAPPTLAPTAAMIPADPGLPHNLVAGNSYQWLITYGTDAAHVNVTTAGPLSTAVVAGTNQWARLNLASAPTGPDSQTLVHVYRKVGANYYHESHGLPTIAANLQAPGGLVYGQSSDASLVAENIQPPAVNTATKATVALANIAIGPTGTTYREVYRTKIGETQLKYVGTISNNTATTYSDAAADSALGANAPATDTSGLSSTSGQVNAGSTTLLLAGTGPFSPTGGWTTTGIRYTGISGNSLTGIPASGPGAITTTLPYGTPMVAAPALTGIAASGTGSILYTIRQGDQVNLRVVVDDVAAQVAMGALLGDDGVIEGALIQDGRISETEAIARAEAQLALRKAIAVGASYTTRDRNVHASREQPFNLTQLVGTLRLQSVTIDGFLPARWPKRKAQASSKRFSLEMLLRQARGVSG